jgi:hypothetical protein
MPEHTADAKTHLSGLFNYVLSLTTELEKSRENACRAAELDLLRELYYPIETLSKTINVGSLLDTIYALVKCDRFDIKLNREFQNRTSNQSYFLESAVLNKAITEVLKRQSHVHGSKNNSCSARMGI